MKEIRMTDLKRRKDAYILMIKVFRSLSEARRFVGELVLGIEDGESGL